MEGIENSRSKFILLQAPTGFGKTICVLSSILGSKRRIFWVVRTGNETDRPIEELEKIFERGHNFKGISLRGKKDMCLLAEKFNAKDNESVQELCRRWKKNCVYYKRLKRFSFFLERPIKFSEIRKICKENMVCPYYLQMELLEDADVISLNYNYVFTPLSKMFLKEFQGSILVVDEAHNLYDYIITSYSDRVTERSFENAVQELRKIGGPGGIIERILGISRKLKQLSKRERIISEEILEYLDPEFLEEIEYYAEKYLDYLVKIGKAPRSSLNHLRRFFETIVSNIGKPGKYLFLFEEKGRWVLEYKDFDVREKLEEIFGRFERIILMSGTLEPVKVTTEMLGIKEYTYIKVPDFVDKNKVISLFLNDVTTRGEEVEERFVGRYERSIRIFLEAPFNVGVYFPSYKVMEIFKETIREACREVGKKVYFEREDMTGHEASEIVKKMGEENSVLVGICGGRFSEGVDFPGKVMEGVYIVGIPFERPSLILRKKMEYFRKIYGRRARYYGYIVPAIRKISQTAGRIIRSKEDRGFFVFGDFRLVRNRIYYNLLPEYLKQNAFVDRSSEIKKYIERFCKIT